MSDAMNPLPRSNPFSSRNVRPGAIPFLFATGETPEQLIERLRAASWWGAIVGPHGSGKSTLVATLAPRLAAAGRRLVSITLHDGQRNLREFSLDLAAVDRQCLVVVDGYEQLSWLARLRLKRLCRNRGCGLLVTSHAPTGLPRLYTTHPDLETALRVVGSLAEVGGDSVRRDDVERLLVARGGNLRDVLFDLYDLYEERRGHRA